MINKIIIDGQNVELTDKSQVPFKHTFAQANTHVVRFGLDSTNEICAYAFQDCTELSYISFPPEIENIKRGAFKGCTSLERVPLSTSIKYIGKEAFDGCKNLKEIDFEHTTPPDVFCTFPSQTILYVPDNEKYEQINFEDMNLDGTVEYFTLNEWSHKYEKIYDVTFCDEHGTYFYNKWQDLGNDEHVRENKNRVPILSIEFPNISQIAVGDTNYRLTYTLTPENITNSQIYWYVQEEGRDIFTVDTDIPEPNQIKIIASDNADYRGSSISLTAYAESGALFQGKLNLV